MELFTGGELFERLMEQTGKRYTEHRAALIIQKMLAAVGYLHSKHIAHRDLKLANFVFEDRSPDAELKLIDFGLSKVSEEN